MMNGKKPDDFNTHLDASKVILKTESLCRNYGEHHALMDLNLTVRKGEVFGYIGPLGAGKEAGPVVSDRRTDGVW